MLGALSLICTQRKQNNSRNTAQRNRRFITLLHCLLYTDDSTIFSYVMRTSAYRYICISIYIYYAYRAIYIVSVSLGFVGTTGGPSSSVALYSRGHVSDISGVCVRTARSAIGRRRRERRQRFRRRASRSIYDDIYFLIRYGARFDHDNYTYLYLINMTCC